MNTLLLEPNDVLFFRDGRPMGGSLSGHGSAWPMPNVINAALHAALHRSDLKGHSHRVVDGGTVGVRERVFGSLVSAGPFPVKDEKWWFPRPADAQREGSAEATLLPNPALSGGSSLPAPLKFPTVSKLPPSKDNKPEPWMDAAAWQTYLHGGETGSFAGDDAFSDAESTYGIGIEASSGTVEEGAFYSASYLRLRDRVSLGILAMTAEKNGDGNRHDLIPKLIDANKGEATIVVGGQQRVCSARPGGANPLPRGMTMGFPEHEGKHLVKWILLSPAIWPEIEAKTAASGTAIQAHSGGWLPNWICPFTGNVLLRVRGERRRNGRSTNAREGAPIAAQLVAAIVPKPLPVTGWALAHVREKPGAKSTHLAVPAGAVYYFEAADAEAAQKLANALNWHGSQAATGNEIINRRSTLMGEKGFGLGVCGGWQPFSQNS